MGWKKFHDGEGLGPTSIRGGRGVLRKVKQIAADQEQLKNRSRENGD